LIGNPSTQAANVTISYLLPNGTTFDKVYQVAAQSRLTISVDGEDPRLAGTSVSAAVNSDVPIVVERSMWWPSPNWYEGSLTAATTETGTKWALAGGYSLAPIPSIPAADAKTYLLVANPSATDAHVTFELQNYNVATCPAVTVMVPAHGRYTAEVRDICPPTMEGAFSGTITSDGPGIVVERSTYWSTNGPTPDTFGQFWAAGASTLLTKIQ
jgi:hypothetical protein